MEIKDEKTRLGWFVGAGIVGADIGTSVFYSTGILFPIVGYLAPAFVVFVCLAMWIFKRTYEEGLAMCPRNGGAYSIILKALGRRAAVASGALTFVSYLATAAVSSLAGSYYICSLFGSDVSFSVVFAIASIPILFFGVLNTKGIKEPAKIVTAIASFHFLFLLVIGIWGLFYLLFHLDSLNMSKFLNPFTSSDLKFKWSFLAYGFASAFLGITGFESAAQIVESLKQPQIKTVEKLYRGVVFVVCLTAPLISFVCLAVLTPEEAHENLNYLLSGVTEKIGGRFLKTLLVVNAGLTLFAATNTALVGFVGLATTMAKNGNLPQIFIQKLTHKFPSFEGYPYIILPFVLITLGMTFLISGDTKSAAQVYGIAFLGVMVSFAVGVMLMRNKGFRKSTPKEYLSSLVIRYKNFLLSVPAIFTSVILSFSFLILLFHATSEVWFMLTFLLSVTSLLMAFYRWTILEQRLISHSDLRLGFGKYSVQPMSDLPHSLTQYVLCIGERQTRRLVMNTLTNIKRKNKGEPFELVLLYAEGEDGESHNQDFYEFLQRVVSQQIAPLIKDDMILTVKILPGNILDSLNTLKKTSSFVEVFFGRGSNPSHSHEVKQEIVKELEVSTTTIFC